MGKSSVGEEYGSPEKLVARVLRHLQRHLLWDSLLLSFPPVLAFFFLEALLYHSASIARGTMIFASAALLGPALLLGLLRLRAAVPSLRLAARLIDERVIGNDRFITLATMNPSLFPPFLVARLRQEAAGLMDRLDLGRDFPYRLKRSFFQSLIVSLAAILLFLLILQLGPVFTRGAAGDDEVARWAQKLSQVPRFSELARSFEALAARLRDRTLDEAERRSLIGEVLRRVENQRQAEQLGGAATDLLNQAAIALQGLGEGLEKGQERGAGGLKDKSSGEEKGSGKESGQGNKEKGQGDLSGLESKELTGAKRGRGEKQQPSQKLAEMDQHGGEGEGKNRDQTREAKGTGKEEAGGKGSKNMGEEIPKGKAAERFLKPGEEGEKAIKGARFVTVELPEEEAGSEAGQRGPGKRRELRPKTPVSNVPLKQPDTPDAAPEKQPLPLEYRGVIR